MNWIFKYRNHLIAFLSFLFLAINLLLISEDFYWLLFLPLILIIIVLFLFSLDYILLIISLLTPLSVVLSLNNGNLGISVPVEPLLIGVCVLFVLRLFFYSEITNRMIRHPISMLLVSYIFWMMLSSLFSEIPLVSLKYLISRIWFIIPLYFAGIQFFKKVRYFRNFTALYVLSLMIVVVYTIIRHSRYGFSEESGHWVMSPFYNDHTAYGAMLTFFIPLLFGFSLIKKYSRIFRIASFTIGIVFILALILSFSRAAWLSLAVALFFGMLIYLKIKFRWVVFASLIALAFLFSFQQNIIQVLEKNTNESSENYVEHIKSVYNISSDASNLERINRWQAAIRLFKERPLFGWGPGTYQFVYAPYQLSQEKTIISTNAGNKGNAHSEYLGPLAEMGLPGMLIVLAIFSMSLISGLRVYKMSVTIEMKIISFTLILALISYFTHGLLNNFLDTDKAAIPVWSSIAMIVAMEMYNADKLAKEVFD